MIAARFRFPLASVACLVFAAACNPSSDNDAGPIDTLTHDASLNDDVAMNATGSDAGPADALSPDATASDARSPDGDLADAVSHDAVSQDAATPPAACAPGALVDLNAVGTLSGVVTRYTVNTDTTAATASIPGSVCQSDVGHEIVFRYTARTTATLRVSTNNAGTSFDTVAWAIDRCASAGATELGCQDDDNGGTHENAATFTTADRVHAGTAVYIVVAGLGGASGTVDLTVAELGEIALGAACDPTGETNVCTTPNQCVTVGGNSTCEQPRYTEMETAAPAFLDACATGTHLALTPGAGSSDARDDGHASAPVALPFAFSLFREAVTTVTPSSNGYAVFGTAPLDGPGGDLAMPVSEEGALVAPFWQNLALRAAPASDICTQTFGTAPNRQFVIEWKDALPTGNTGSHLTFEAVLSETTNAIDFVYSRLEPGTSPPEESDGTSAAIGLQSAMGVRYIVHDGSVATDTALHYAPTM